jgi:amidase
MRFEEYRRHDAIALAGLIAKREVSAKEVRETAIARAEQVNPALNAIVHKQYEQALKAVAAGPPEGPLKGVPYLYQGPRLLRDRWAGDLGQQLVQGFCRRSRDRVCDALQEGRPRVHGPQLEPRVRPEPEYGAAALRLLPQPVEPRILAGGFSGGAPAAVSAGILPVAHATDGGGSIRIPAAQCGLFGLKPSRGRVSMAPDAGEGWDGISTGHVVSRSVRDSALMLDCTVGPEPGDPYAAPMEERPFLEALALHPANSDRADAQGSSRCQAAS